MPAIAGVMFAFAAALGACAVSGADGAPIAIEFWFVPAKASYEPGENFTIELTATNMITSGDYIYDDYAYMEKVVNISVHFSWMPPGVYEWKYVGNTSSWLAPDLEGSEMYSISLQVPENATQQTHSYSIIVEYLAHTPWGNITYQWGVGETYRDFVVAETAEESDHDADISATASYVPLVAAAALILSIGAIGAAMYYKRGPPAQGARKVVAEGAAVPAIQQNGYPVIHPMPGEQFPIEKGFIYLVKEKRPSFAFQMYNEAVEKGAKGMVIAREHPNRLTQLYRFRAEKILWLTRRVGKDHNDPTELSLLHHKISRFVEENPKSVVLLEGLEYMITQNEFEPVLRFVDHLHDFVLAHDCAVVIVIDPRVLSTRELALLERSTKIVEPLEVMDSAAVPPLEQEA